MSQTSGTTEPLYGVSFTDVMTGTAVGLGGIFRTTDGGSSWVHQGGSRYADVCFGSAMRGVVVGGDFLFGGFLSRTTDGGATWGAPTIRPTTSALCAVSFYDALRGWAVGYDGTILRTDDGGYRWRSQTAGGLHSFSGVSSADPT